ncbi:MAG: aldehyde dehydrogenase [Candidatus Aminicenantes bacterium]|nr:MAG: aldehyde dehydrogenase [Candidatus Aminicenantes bacterium]RLE05095.1 MAG: aldehyde dehydrogenase [Candidatus Aminicenantes bacterium]
MTEYKLWINGQAVDGFETREILSPYDGTPVAKVHFANRALMQQAIDSAAHAFQQTKSLSSHERYKILEKISQTIADRKEELAQSIALVAGKPIRSARTEVERAVNTFLIAAEEAKRIYGELIPLDLTPATKDRWGLVRRFPLGVIAGITPFNFPLNLVAHKMAPAIASGNAFILRPASQVSPTALLLGEIVHSTDIPPGGVNILPSSYNAAEALLEEEQVKMVTFTGSPAVGWPLKKKAPKKRVTLELGGNAAVVIEPDADLEYAISRCLLGAFAYAGQICISIQRIFLHEKIYDRFLNEFIAQTKKLKVGNPLEEETDVGPMITLEAAEQIEQWIQEAVEEGARILTGGKREGNLVEPTILENVKPELRISWLEAFAPVVVIYKYNDFSQALENVNYSIYGLQAGVFTHNLNKAFQAFEKLDVGGVIINDIPTFRVDHMPYGGVKESGFGREGLRYAIEEMTELKLMVVNLKTEL